MKMKKLFWIAVFVFILSPFSVSGEIVTEEWVAKSGGGSPSDMAVDSSGNVYVTEDNNFYTRSSDYVTIKYNTSGNEVWSKIYDGGYDEHPVDIAVDASGNVYVTGGGGGYYFTIKYSQAPSMPAEVISVVNEMVSSSAITNSGLANALTSSLNNAQTLVTTNPTAAKNMLEATINKIEAQSGKQISVDAAEKLLGYLNSIIDGL